MELTSFVECILFNTVFCLLVVPCLSAAWEDVKFDLILCIENIYTPQPKTQSQWQWSTLRQLSMAVYFLLGPKQIVGSEGFPKAEFVFIQLRHFQRFLSGDKSARAYRNGNSSALCWRVANGSLAEPAGYSKSKQWFILYTVFLISY